MSECSSIFCVCVVLCVGSSHAAMRWADPPSKMSYRLCMDLEIEKAAKVHKGCKAIDR
jgi:hypothetical protein